jgi:hypothetical protein
MNLTSNDGKTTTTKNIKNDFSMYILIILDKKNYFLYHFLGTVSMLRPIEGGRTVLFDKDCIGSPIQVPLVPCQTECCVGGLSYRAHL